MNRFAHNKALIAVILAGALTVAPASAREWSKEYEEQVGDEAVAAITEEYEIYENEEAQQRVDDIVKKLVPHTQRPDVEYRVYLLDSDEVNAFSVPGGHFFLHRGLLDKVESEAQLVGVIAHEMAHNCTYDSLAQVGRAHKMVLATAVMLIVAVATGRTSETAYGVLTAGQIVARGILSKYSIEIETRADRNAVAYLLAAGYDAVGLLTFMEDLARKERKKPTTELGILQTHPLSKKRVADLIDLLDEAGVIINRRAVTKWDPPVVETGEMGGKPAQILKLWDEPLFAFAHSPGGGDIALRGERMVEVLTELLRDGVRAFEFCIVQEKGETAISARGQKLLTVYPEDAALAGKSVGDTTAAASQAIRRALYQERLNRLYGNVE